MGRGRGVVLGLRLGPGGSTRTRPHDTDVRAGEDIVLTGGRPRKESLPFLGRLKLTWSQLLRIRACCPLVRQDCREKTQEPRGLEIKGKQHLSPFFGLSQLSGVCYWHPAGGGQDAARDAAKYRKAQ